VSFELTSDESQVIMIEHADVTVHMWLNNIYKQLVFALPWLQRTLYNPWLVILSFQSLQPYSRRRKLNFIPPKRRFWTYWQKMKSRFSIYLSSVWVLDLGYEQLQSISKNPDFLFCQSFQHLRLGSINFWPIVYQRLIKQISTRPIS
jgi:hypothetical protein